MKTITAEIEIYEINGKELPVEKEKFLKIIPHEDQFYLINLVIEGNSFAVDPHDLLEAVNRVWGFK